MDNTVPDPAALSAALELFNAGKYDEVISFSSGTAEAGATSATRAPGNKGFGINIQTPHYIRIANRSTEKLCAPALFYNCVR